MTEKPLLRVLLGPTASGKTRLAARWAAAINGEIISADSRQVYRDMTIGTGKDYGDYLVDNQEIKYHLIDIREAGEKYHVADFQQDFAEVFQDIIARGKQPILCGGTGLYIEAVLRQWNDTQIPIDDHLRKQLDTWTDEALQQEATRLATFTTIDTSTRKRLIRGIERALFLQDNPNFDTSPQLPFRYQVVGLQPERDIRRKRIEHRLHLRLEAGLLEEVQGLLAQGLSANDLIYYGLEYKYCMYYWQKQLSYAEFVEKLTTEIQRFAKRQMTYFRSMEKKGIEIDWLPSDASPDQQLAYLLQQKSPT